MRDLAALTPPLVMAVAFIAGVVALLRREMAPRRRRDILRQDVDLTPGAARDAASADRSANRQQMPPAPDRDDDNDGYGHK